MSKHGQYSKFMKGSPVLIGDATVPGVQIDNKLKVLLPKIFQAVTDFGCDYYDTVVQMLTYDEISEVAAYGGFPVRYPHWKWGMEYEELARGYEHGMHRIYEMVINCCVARTRVLTERGSTTIDCVQAGDKVLGPNGWRNVAFVEKQNPSKVYKIKLEELSMSLECTSRHKWKCWRDGDFAWVEAKDIRSGDLIFAGSNFECNLESPVQIEWTTDKVFNETRANVRHRLLPIKPPNQMTIELAELLGIVAGDGSQGVRLASGSIAVCIHKSQRKYQQHVVRLFQDVFGREAAIYEKKKSVNVVNLSSKYAVDFFDEVGLEKGCTYKTKRVPCSIWSSSNEYKAAFLRGVFDTDGHCGRSLSVSCYSDELAQDIQLLLLELGIRSKFKRVTNKHNDIAVLTIKGKAHVRKFAKMIGFNLEYKQVALDQLISMDGRSGKNYKLEGLVERIFDRIDELNEQEEIPEWMYKYRHRGFKVSNVNSIYGFLHRVVSAGYEEIFSDLYQISATPAYVVESNELSEERVETFDLALLHDDHDFLANGLWSHNTNPCYIYCLDSNTLVDNVTVVAHALGHCDFFKNNIYFEPTLGSQNMLNKMANHGTRIRRYMTRWGKEKVTEFIDHVLRINTLVDSAKAWKRKKIKNPIIKDERKYEHPSRLMVAEGHDYMEPYVNTEEWRSKQLKKIERKEAAVSLDLFDEPTKDILGFIRDFAPLKPWQADIVAMLYEEAMYFAPQRPTKMLNEGWASFIDYNIMAKQGFTSLGTDEPSSGIIEYADHKRGVLGGKYSMNPYKLGFCMFQDIEERWNKGQFGSEWEECSNMQEKKEWDKKLNLGHDKVFEVRKYYNDVTAIIEFFTPEFCEKYEFFEWKKYPNGEYRIESKDPKKIKTKLLRRYVNGGLPDIRLADLNHKGKGFMLLEHQFDSRPLYDPYVRPVLESLRYLWKNDVYLATKNSDGKEFLYYCIDNVESVGVISREDYLSQDYINHDT